MTTGTMRAPPASPCRDSTGRPRAGKSREVTPIEVLSFGTLLRRFRLAAGLTQEELAERAGLSVRGISDLERGVNRAPYRETVARVIKALHLSPEDGEALEAGTSRRRGPVAGVPVPGPARLPAQPTSLIGREQEEAAVIHLLRWEGRRLLTLIGPGGVGKTRLAVQVAAATAADFADGAVFISLAGVRDPAQVLSTIAGTLGVRDIPAKSSAESLADYLRDREILMLLDNSEHVLAAAPLLAELLAACPRVKALVTSRAALRLRGEQAIEVPPLATPPAVPAFSLDELPRFPAVVLFLERARSVNSDFVLTSQNAGAVSAICRAVDGLPLAIELAAVRLSILSPAALLSRLEHRLQVLTGGTRDVAARQQNMRNTIAWSHDLLNDDEQMVFRRMSVFVGGETAEAVGKVCGAGGQPRPDIFDVLTSLVDQSLCTVLKEEAGEPRFAMLQTIKEFAGEQLDSCGERGTTVRRHAEYFLWLAEQAGPELRGPDSQSWSRRVDQSHDDLLAVLDWCHETGHLAEGMRIAGAIWWYWYTRGYLSEGLRRLESLLAADEAGGRTVTPDIRSKALRGAGVLATELGEYGAAVAFIEESLLLARELGDRHTVGTLLTVLGNIAKYQADYDRATVHYGDALALLRDLGDVRSVSVLLNNLGNVAKEQSDYTRAIALYDESLTIKRELNDQRGIAIVLSNIGTMAHAQGDDERAIAAGEESVTLLRELNDKDLAAALDTLARAVLAQGHTGRALELYREGLLVSQATGERQMIAFCLEGVGRVAGAQGDAERAARLYGAAVALRASIGAPLSPAEQAQDEPYLDAARRELGDAGFEAAWNAGRALSLERALAAALDRGT